MSYDPLYTIWFSRKKRVYFVEEAGRPAHDGTKKPKMVEVVTGTLDELNEFINDPDEWPHGELKFGPYCRLMFQEVDSRKEIIPIR